MVTPLTIPTPSYEEKKREVEKGGNLARGPVHKAGAVGRVTRPLYYRLTAHVTVLAINASGPVRFCYDKTPMHTSLHVSVSCLISTRMLFQVRLELLKLLPADPSIYSYIRR